MRRAYLMEILLVLLMAGCAEVAHAPPRTDSAIPGPAPAPVVAAPALAPESAAPVASAAVDTPEAHARGTSVARTSSPPGKGTVKSPAAPAAPAAPSIPAPVAAAIPRNDQAPPTLDLAALEARLRGTKAIGMFTKIAIKNQVDDLLDQFREHYSGRVKTSLVALRQPYDRLILKVLALLQDGDPDLARAVVASREPMWDFLADPARFATL
jgi:hypothetical protein